MIFNKRMKLHIGNEIRKELQKQERTVIWLASKLRNGDPSNLGKKLHSEHIKHELLYEISFVLKKDFFTFYSAQLSEEIYGKKSP